MEGASMPVPELSPIEERVALLVAGGRSTQAVADELGVSVRTIDWHLARARRKLERAATLHDRIQRAPKSPQEGERE